MEAMTIRVYFDLVHSCKPALLRCRRRLRLNKGQYYLIIEIPVLCLASLVPSKYNWVKAVLIIDNVFSLMRLPFHRFELRFLEGTNRLVHVGRRQFATIAPINRKWQVAVFDLFGNELLNANPLAQQA